jgi:hypothetical protein
MRVEFKVREGFVAIFATFVLICHDEVAIFVAQSRA